MKCADYLSVPSVCNLIRFEQKGVMVLPDTCNQESLGLMSVKKRKECRTPVQNIQGTRHIVIYWHNTKRQQAVARDKNYWGAQ